MDKNVFEYILSKETFINDFFQLIEEYDKVILEHKVNIDNHYRNFKTYEKCFKGNVDELIKKRLKTQLNPITLVYYFNKVRLDTIYNRKKSAYYSSNPQTIQRLHNAVKFQLISNYKWVKDLNTQNKEYLSNCFICKFLLNINNVAPYIPSSINLVVTVDKSCYRPLTSLSINDLSSKIVKELESGDFSIVNTQGAKCVLDPFYEAPEFKNPTPAKISQSNLEIFIEKYVNIVGKRPSCAELRE